MWDYVVVTNVLAQDYHMVCQKWEHEGYSLYESNYFRSSGSTLTVAQSAWDLVFRRHSSTPDRIGEDARDARRKLSEVRDALAPMTGSGDPQMPLGRVLANIDEFLFKGSPSDM